MIRPLTAADEPEARQAQLELADEGHLFLLDVVDGEPWAEYVARMDRRSRGVDVPADRVPATFHVGVAGGRVAARVSVRHELNDFLARWGGHIGYMVRPQFRRRGYATALLRHGLAVARAVGVDRALLVCDDDNVGSAAVIERCGGELEGVVPGPDGTGPQRRYWVDTGSSPT